MPAIARPGDIPMEPGTERDKEAETPTNTGEGVVGILNDVLLQLQRIEVALAA
jgi:hypothetical protein